MRRELSFVSLFSGCGGLDVGFEQAGFRGLFAGDIDELAVSVHSRNLKTPGQVVDLSTRDVLSLRGLNPDIVVAGPPCQGFSTLGKRRVDDPRNSLIIAAARHAVILKPKVVVLENVSGAISGKHGRYWRTATDTLSEYGYVTETRPIVCSDFGVPQIRRRMLLVAWKGKQKSFPAFQSIERVDLKTALQHLDGKNNHEPAELKRQTPDHRIAQRIAPHQKLCNVRGGDRAVPTWAIPEVFGRTNVHDRQVLCAIRKLRRQIRLRASGDADPVMTSDISQYCGVDVSDHVERLLRKGYLRTIDERVDLAHTFNGKYRRLSWDHPAPAVDTRFGDPKYYLHPEEDRGLSVREAARIQGFPDDFVFDGPRAAQFRMVGNAVPPPLAKQLAESIREFLS
ncbi:MAG: DNA cytosine methyltransferase [Planctomycetota bacterium]|jgi:DNA (cytosine-5)-methyltransferase 1